MKDKLIIEQAMMEKFRVALMLLLNNPEDTFITFIKANNITTPESVIGALKNRFKVGILPLIDEAAEIGMKVQYTAEFNPVCMHPRLEIFISARLSDNSVEERYACYDFSTIKGDPEYIEWDFITYPLPKDKMAAIRMSNKEDDTCTTCSCGC